MGTKRMRVGIAVTLVGVAGVVGACSDDSSDDCLRTERALRPWGNTMPGAMRTRPPEIALPAKLGDEAPDYAAAAAREAQAAKDIRAATNAVESPTLREKLHEMADAFDLVAESRTDPAASTRDYFAAMSKISAALHDIKQACPDIGDDVPPPTRS